MNIITTFIQGVVIGIGNIIPGVSGGTLALVLGIYERLINALNNISGETIKAAFGALTLKAEARAKFAVELKRIDASFLMVLGIGAVLAVGALSKLISYLLIEQHDPTYGFFMGLILFSIAVPYQLLKRKTLGCLVSALIAAALVYTLSNLQTNEEKVASAQKKYEIKMVKQQAAQNGKSSTREQEERLPVVDHDAVTLLLFFAAGALAISAMILPGVSGSFLMLLLGVYFDLLASISQLDVVVLTVFALGCGVGLIFFTKLLHYVLDRYHDLTMSFLVGLMIGSLFEIWPFKLSEKVGDTTIYLNNVLPSSFASNEAITLVSFVIGGGIVLAFLAYEKRKA